MRRLATYGALVLALGGCAQRADPVQVTESFHRALARGDGEAAMRHLSEETRAELERRAQKASEVAGRPVSAAEMIVGGDTSRYPAPWSDEAKRPAKATLLESDGREARVEVTAAGETRELKLVREPAGWRIVLQLAPAPGS